jgi:2-hydroxycyclohexanecarboxyl-CoA dehydrogenase
MSVIPYWDSPPTAIVTGGASGIGLAIAQRLSTEGAAVAIFDLDGSAAKATEEAIIAVGARALGLAVDVTDRSRTDTAVAEVAQVLGSPTILVNSAGLDGFENFLDITSDSWRKILAVNLTGTFDCCQAVVPHMIDAKGGASSTSPHRVHKPATRE